MPKILKLNNKLDFEEIEVKSRIVEYDELRKAVGGYIEHITFNRKLDEAHIDVWCDEEGKLKDLDPTTIVLDKKDKIVEVLAGELVFTARDREGNSLALDDFQVNLIESVMDYMTMVMFKNVGPKLVRVLPYR